MDELGFGILRDAFADEFFPGTSTIMTEVRYLIFIPALYRAIERALERSSRAVPVPERRIREMQDRLRDVLAKSYHYQRGHGVIGLLAGKKIERYPAAIYWNALRTLGILRLPRASESDYQRLLLQHHVATRPEDNPEDPVAEVARRGPNWDRSCAYYLDAEGLLDERGDPINGLTFELTTAEARYLRDCYLGTDPASPPRNALHRSLLAHLIDYRYEADFKYPWNVPLPEHLRVAVHDAKRLSALARGATLQYYYWLSDARQTDRPNSRRPDLAEALVYWWKEGRPLLDDWDLPAFLERRRSSLRQQRDDNKFLTSWLNHCRAARNSGDFLRDRIVRELLVNRELRCKPRKARLTHFQHLHTGKLNLEAENSAYQLEYRARIGGIFVRGIVGALSGSGRQRRSATAVG